MLGVAQNRHMAQCMKCTVKVARSIFYVALSDNRSGSVAMSTPFAVVAPIASLAPAVTAANTVNGAFTRPNQCIPFQDILASFTGNKPFAGAGPESKIFIGDTFRRTDGQHADKKFMTGIKMQAIAEAQVAMGVNTPAATTKAVSAPTVNAVAVMQRDGNMSAMQYDVLPTDQHMKRSAVVTTIPAAAANVSGWGSMTYGGQGALDIAGEFGDSVAYTGGMTTVQDGVFAGGIGPDAPNSVLSYANAATWSGPAGVTLQTDASLGRAVSNETAPNVVCSASACPADYPDCGGDTLGCWNSGLKRMTRSFIPCCVTTHTSSAGGLTGPAKSAASASVPAPPVASNSISDVLAAVSYSNSASSRALRAIREQLGPDDRRISCCGGGGVTPSVVTLAEISHSMAHDWEHSSALTGSHDHTVQSASLYAQEQQLSQQQASSGVPGALMGRAYAFYSSGRF
jgi:hypothetical protein